MVALYIHIPFCAKKCGYCSFPVIPLEKLQEPGGMTAQYKAALFRDIESWSEKLDFQSIGTGYNKEGLLYTDSSADASKYLLNNNKQETPSSAYHYPLPHKKPLLKTIYFGGGTPLLLGSQYIIDIMTHIEKHFDIADLQELSIECNPYPYKETVEAVKNIMETYNHLSRLRFSFGIQSLDDDILRQSNRDCSFAGIQQFTKDLLDIKAKNTLYNYDFISFGEKDSSLRSEGQVIEQKQRLQKLLASQKIDSCSLYTLELFPGAKWYHETKDPLIAYQAPREHDMPFATSEDAILDQFEDLKKMFLAHGYKRYEISNYALPGKESLHNTVYRTMGAYLGIGLGAHGLIKKDSSASHSASEWPKADDEVTYRTANTGGWKKYIDGNAYENTELSEQDILIESFFLALRTAKGIEYLPGYATILHPDREQRIAKLVSEGLATYAKDSLSLTDGGMNVHHRVCDYLMLKI